MSAMQAFTSLGRSGKSAVVFMLFATIAALDFATGTEFTLRALYVLPVGLAAWTSGMRLAVMPLRLHPVVVGDEHAEAHEACGAQDAEDKRAHLARRQVLRVRGPHASSRRLVARDLELDFTGKAGFQGRHRRDRALDARVLRLSGLDQRLKERWDRRDCANAPLARRIQQRICRQ
jgi:hypothetical protein